MRFSHWEEIAKAPHRHEEDGPPRALRHREMNTHMLYAPADECGCGVASMGPAKKHRTGTGAQQTTVKAVAARRPAPAAHAEILPCFESRKHGGQVETTLALCLLSVELLERKMSLPPEVAAVVKTLEVRNAQPLYGTRRHLGRVARLTPPVGKTGLGSESSRGLQHARPRDVRCLQRARC